MKANLTIIANYPAPLRLGIFILLLLLLWLPIAIPLYFWLKNDPNLTTIVTMGMLYLEFIGLLFFWNQTVYQISDWWRVYGSAFTRKNAIELFNGLSIGLFFTFGLFLIEGMFGWVKFNHISIALLPIILEGLLSALGIALAEEVFFRGWLLSELRRDYSPQTTVFANGIIFATLHFLKPLEEIMRTFPQFPALCLLGFTLVWAKWSQGNRIGISIGLHGGLVWGYYIFTVGNLLIYTDEVSPLITGIDQNPLAGAMGLIFLSILSLWMRQKASNQII